MLTKLNLFAVVFFGFIITSASVSFAFNVAVDAVIVAKKKGCEKYAVKIRELLETFRAKIEQGADNRELAEVSSAIDKATGDLERCEKRDPGKKINLNNITLVTPQGTISIPIGRKKK